MRAHWHPFNPLLSLCVISYWAFSSTCRSNMTHRRNSYQSILEAFEQKFKCYIWGFFFFLKRMLNNGIYIEFIFYQGETKIDSPYTWECIVVKNRREKHEEIDHQSSEDSTNSSPNWFRKNNAHLFRLQILLQTLPSIISHHKKSTSISYNAKSEAILRLLLFTNVSNLTHFSVENFSCFFFLPLYRVVKKGYGKMHQTEIQRLWSSLCRGFGFHWFWIRRKPAAPTRSLSQASYTGGRGRGGSGGGGCVGVVRGVHFHSSSPPTLLYESAKTLLFGT